MLTMISGSVWAQESEFKGVVTTSLDGKTLTSWKDIEGITLTFVGAKKVELQKFPQGLLLCSKNGDKIYAGWNSSYNAMIGIKCEAKIEGNKVTLTGFSRSSMMMSGYGRIENIPADATNVYLEDYGTFVVDGMETFPNQAGKMHDYIDTIEFAYRDPNAPNPDDATKQELQDEQGGFKSWDGIYQQVLAATVENADYSDAKYSQVVWRYTNDFGSVRKCYYDEAQRKMDEYYAAGTLTEHKSEIEQILKDGIAELQKVMDAFYKAVGEIDNPTGVSYIYNVKGSASSAVNMLGQRATGRGIKIVGGKKILF